MNLLIACLSAYPMREASLSDVEKLRIILNALPLEPPRDEADIEELAKWLAGIVSPNASHARKAVVELFQIKTDAEALLKKLEALSEPAKAMWQEMRSEYPEHAPSIDDSILALWRLAGISESDSLPGRGRPPDDFAKTLAEDLAYLFHSLTGREATVPVRAGDEREGRAYGPFLDFVTAVFEVVGCNAKSESFAKVAAQNRMQFIFVDD